MKKQLLSLTLALTASVLFILSGADNTFARVDQIPTGTRPMGMAGAFLTVGGDSNTIGWNPAAMPFVRHQALGFNYHRPSDLIDITDQNLSYLLAITDRHAIGLDWFRIGFDDAEYQFNENRYLLAYGYNPYKSLSLGVSFKYLTQGQTLDNIDAFDAKGMGVDLGVIFSPTERLRVGVVALDATDTWMKFSEGARDKVFDRTLRFGASYQPRKGWTVAADYDDGPHVGAEYWFANTLAIRGGVYDDFQADDGLRYAIGGSVKYSIFQLDYAFNTHPVLPDTSRVSMSLAFELTPTLVRVEEIQMQPIFSTFYQEYANQPVGQVVLRNKANKPLPVSVSVFLPAYMEAPTEIAQDVVLIGQTGDELAFSEPISITPVLNDKILGIAQNTQTQAEISVTYEYLNRTRTVQKSGLVTIYRPGIVPLGSSVAPIAALIDPDDPVVHQFAREVVGRYTDSDIISKNISKASLLFEALNSYGIKYVPDPYNPYSEISGKQEAIDSVMYPRDILNPKNKTGDCDDGSALYAALLENVGIHTALVDVPGHVYVMFDTGIHSNNVERMGLPESQYIVKDGKIWLPVEVTMYGQPFTRAWQEGLSEYHKWKAQNQLKLVDVHQAWVEGYQPTRPQVAPSEIVVPEAAEIAERMLVTREQTEQMQDEFLLALAEKIEMTSDSELDIAEEIDSLNRLGITYALQNELEQAEEQFQEILTLEPEGAVAYNNLANLYIISDRMEDAILIYQRATELSPDDPGIALNLGIGYLMTDDSAAAQETLAQAFQQLGDYQAACDLVGVPSQEPIMRAAEGPMLADEIRSLFIKAARGEDVGAEGKQVRQRAAEAEAAEIYLYWKR